MATIRIHNVIYFIAVIASLLVILFQASCAFKNCNAKKRYSLQEQIARSKEIGHIAKEINHCVVKAPSMEQMSQNGDVQVVCLDLAILKERLATYSIKYIPPHSLEMKGDHEYRIQLGWVGKDLSCSRQNQQICLSFVNSNDMDQLGYYLYTVYDDNNVVWHTYLYDMMGKDAVPVNISLPITPCDDENNLTHYLKTFVSAP